MKKTPDNTALWAHIEAFAHLIPGDQGWYNSDDGEGVAQTMQLIGFAVISTIKALQSHDLFRPDSPIEDFSLVLGLLISAAVQWPGSYDEPELSWAKAVISEAKEHGIELAGVPFGVEEDVKKFEGLDDDEDAPDWKDFDWKKEVC
jgi:hypothetical protein